MRTRATSVQADDGTTIDVMVLYTPAALTATGGTAAMNALISLGISETNTSYSISGITQRVRLVYSAQVSYTERGDISADLSALQRSSSVAAARTTYGADLVTMLTETPNSPYCGVAYGMDQLSSSFAPFAFNVVERTCVSPNYSFAHELGHNMGAQHDWYADPTIGLYTYSHGHVNPGARWRTMMSYNDMCSVQGFNCTRLLYWSNPSVFRSGAAMGVPAGTQTTWCTVLDHTTANRCDADDHLTLNNTALTVANFRQSVVVTPAPASTPAPPGDSTSGSGTCTSIKPAPDWVCVNGGWVPPTTSTPGGGDRAGPVGTLSSTPSRPAPPAGA